MTLYYAEGRMGCTIIQADRIEQARREIRSDQGDMGSPFTVRKATPQDIAWVAGMGGPDYQKGSKHV